MNEWTAEQSSVLPCSYLFIVYITSCAATSCSSSPYPSNWAPVDSAPALPTVMVVAVAHPLMSRFSNKCFALALCCVLSWMFVLSCFRSIWLVRLPFQWLWCQHWLAFALTNHAPPNTSPRPPPLKIMTGCCDDDFLLCCASTSCLLRLWHPTLPMSCTNWWLPSRALSMTDCALGNGVVHQNLGFLLTGTTFARNVSTRSKGRPFPWATTPPSPKREYRSISRTVCALNGISLAFIVLKAPSPQPATVLLAQVCVFQLFKCCMFLTLMCSTC